jgi:hypothetical protein
MKSGKLNCLEPSGPLQACNGTALPFLTGSVYSIMIFSSVLLRQICLDTTERSLVSTYTSSNIHLHWIIHPQLYFLLHILVLTYLQCFPMTSNNLFVLFFNQSINTNFCGVITPVNHFPWTLQWICLKEIHLGASVNSSVLNIIYDFFLDKLWIWTHAPLYKDTTLWHSGALSFDSWLTCCVVHNTWRNLCLHQH